MRSRIVNAVRRQVGVSEDLHFWGLT
jgi:hypothetical protein